MASAKGLHGMGTAVDAANRQMDDTRRAFTNVINASKEYEVRQVKTATLAEDYAKRLKDQKVHMVEAMKNGKLMNQVIRDQIALQKAQAVAWRKDSSGRITADLIMPQEGLSRLQNARVTLGVINQTIGSAADNMVKWGKNTQWAGRQLTVGFSVPLGIAAAATGKLAFEMDKGLTQITKVYGDANSAVQDSVESIRTAAENTATNMAALYGQSAKDTLEIEAQFAAAGKTGVELQQAAAAATKARTLNEIDLQTAIDASINMQTVYGYSAEQLGQKWDYINAVANQTILSAEDFAVAIPKVSGVMKELGGSLEDVGVLMTAMKSAGIDAAEGANALKTISFRSVAAYGRGLETFKEMTGKDLKQIVDQTNGETIPTLLAMYKAMENLTKPQRIKVVKDVFGIYQGNKALMLLEQLSSQSQQVAQAMAVGKNSIAENAAIANQELARMNAQPFKRIQKAIESIKLQMQKLGQAVLPLAAGFLEGVSALMEWVNGLDSGKKRIALILAAAVGLAGPLTMLIGLFANLFGNVIKLFTSFGNLITRYKIVDAQERAQILLAKQANNAWDSQTSAVARLVQELQIYGASLQEIVAMQKAQAAGLNSPIVRPASIGPSDGMTISKRDAAGRWQHFLVDEEGKSKRISATRLASLKKEQGALADIQQQEAARLAIMQEEALMIDAQRNKLVSMTQRGGAALAGGGLLATMFSSNGTVQNLGGLSLIVGSLMSMFPKVSASIMKNLVAPFRVFGGVVSKNLAGAMTGIRALGAGVASFASAAAAPLAVAAAGVLIYWKKVSDAADEANEKAKNAVNSARDLAEILGVNYQESSTVPGATPTNQQQTVDLAEQFKKKNADAAEELRKVGKDEGEQWGAAIAQGVQIRLHGGTAEAAKQAVRIAMQIMGKSFTDAEFEVAIKPKVDFDNANEMIKKSMDNINKQVDDAMNEQGSTWEKWNRSHIMGQDDLTKSGKTKTEAAAKEAFNTMMGIPDEKQRKRFFDQLVQSQGAELQDLYKKWHAAGYKAAKGSYDDFLKTFNEMNVNSLVNMGYDKDTADRLKKQADSITIFAQSFADLATSLTPEQIKKLESLNNIDISGLFGGKQVEDTAMSAEQTSRVMSAYGNALDKAAQSGKTLTQEEKLGIYNRARVAEGLGIVTSLSEVYAYAQGQMADAAEKAADSQLNLADAMKQVNLNPAITEEQVTSAYRSVMEGVNNDMVEAANDSLSREADVASQALQNSMDAAMKVYDDKADALDKKYDDRQKAMEKRHDAEDDAFDKRWDARTVKETAYYDNRIKAVDDAIEAEKNAEEIRQKIFEAEKNRIARMSEMYNRNIDFNVAVNSGNLDEAAKISNDAQAATEQWLTEDAQGQTQDASDKRVSALEKQKDSISAGKDARLKALKDVEDAEKKALQDRQQRETDSLKMDQDNAKKRLDIQKAAAQAYWEDQKDKNQKVWEDRKRNLQLELDTIRAYIPRDKKELQQQAADIDKAYKKYGVNLTDYGKEWSGIIGRSMNTNISKSANDLKTAVKWGDIGSIISNQLIKGGFGMTAKQFATWLNGGEAPKGTLFAATDAQKKAARVASGNYGGGGITRHKGGMIDNSAGSRAGHSGTLDPSERMVTALVGESMLNRKATDFLGKENIDALNSGKLPKNTGPWGMTGVGAALAAGATKRVMGQVLNVLAQRKILMDSGMDFGTGAVAGKAGMYAGVALSQEQLANAAAIVGVGKSLGASNRDLVIAIMTAMQESTLRNISYGDRDSVGLFQQRNAWGSMADRMNPAKSARMFFLGGAQGQRGLFDFPNRGNMTLAQAAQAVQVSAFPDAYAKWQAMATAVLGGTKTNSVASGGFGMGINMGQYAASGGGGWTMPANGPVTSRYGMRVNPVTGQYRLHAGSDIGASAGTVIRAAKSGRVVSAGPVSGYGNYTIIDHGNGIRTAYAHQSKILVSPGQLVSAGQTIGKVGSTGNSTGPHLHFEYMKNGQRLNPNQIIPSLNVGGWAMSDGLARLHKDEPVLTKPLGSDLKEGLNKFANGDNSKYNMYMDFRGANFSENVDVEKAIDNVMKKKERRVGVKRSIGK